MAKLIGRTEPFSLIIKGCCASKSNSRRLVYFRDKKTGVKKPAFIKSDAAIAFSDQFAQQCPSLTPMFLGDVHLDIDIYYMSRRSDLDETLVLDLLQGRIYENDRQVRSRRTRWGLSPLDPRVEIHVRLMESGDRAGD